MKHLTSIISLKLYFLAFIFGAGLLMFMYSCGTTRYKTTYGHHNTYGGINRSHHVCASPEW